MPRLLKDLRIHEVSSVDRGAGEGVKILLMKRDDSGGQVIDFNQAREAVRAGGIEKVDFKEVARDQKTAEHANHFMRCAQDAMRALDTAIVSIMFDPEIGDKRKAIESSLSQFKSHMADLVPAEMEKAMTTKEPTVADLMKKIDEMATGQQAELAKRDLEIAILKLSPAEQAYAAALTTDDLRKAFAAKKPEERKEEMEAEDKKKRAGSALPVEVQKALDEAAKDRVILKQLQDERAAADFRKRATDLGLAEADGEIMQKAYSGDAAAQKQLDEKIKSLTEQARVGGVFSEIGKGAGVSQAGGKAYEQLVAKAEEIRKADAKLTKEQAFAKVYTDPANVELVTKHRQDEAQARARVAA